MPSVPQHRPRPLTPEQSAHLTRASQNRPLPLFRHLETEDEIRAALKGHWMFCETCHAYENWGILQDRPTLIASPSSAYVLQK